jgi:hypothetical protein
MSERFLSKGAKQYVIYYIRRDVCETLMPPPLDIMGMNGNCKLFEFFEVQGAELCQKLLDRTQNRT